MGSATKDRLRSALGVSKFLFFFFFFSLFRRLRLRMGEKFAWMPIAFVFIQLISLSLQEDGIADVRANYQEMRNREKRSRRAAQEGYEYDEESRRAFKLHNYTNISGLYQVTKNHNSIINGVSNFKIPVTNNDDNKNNNQNKATTINNKHDTKENSN